MDRADETREELLVLERRGWDALCTGMGGEFYEDRMTDDGVMVLAHGVVMNRSQVRSSLATAPPWWDYTLSDVRLVPVGPATAALVYRARATRGKDDAFEALMTSVYVLDGHRPLLALYQQTPVPRG